MGNHSIKAAAITLVLLTCFVNMSDRSARELHFRQ